MLRLAPTERHTVLQDGTARVLRFGGGRSGGGRPVLLVPSLINRWYVLDLRPGGSLVEALVEAGLEVFCLDWGRPRAEDRYLEWDDLVARLGRAIRRVQRLTGARQVGLLGYSMGATLCTIVAALEPGRVGALVNLAGPIDFSRAGVLAHLADPRWLDAEAIAAAGNVHPLQIRAGLVAVRPTDQLAKWVRWLDALEDAGSLPGSLPRSIEAACAVQAWIEDGVPFPAAAYLRYVRDLYQRNELVQGRHHVGGRRVALEAIDCPLLVVVPEHDDICPPEAALALTERVSSERTDVLRVEGGHIEAVVGPRAARALYPALGGWLKDTLWS